MWPIDAIWWHKTGSILVQLMACCLTAPSHYLNQSWLLIHSVVFHRAVSHEMLIIVFPWYDFENYKFEITTTPPKVQWVNLLRNTHTFASGRAVVPVPSPAADWVPPVLTLPPHNASTSHPTPPRYRPHAYRTYTPPGGCLGQPQSSWRYDKIFISINKKPAFGITAKLEQCMVTKLWQEIGEPFKHIWCSLTDHMLMYKRSILIIISWYFYSNFNEVYS